MIFIGIGSNLTSQAYRSPHDTAKAALAALPPLGITVVRCSPWYESEPVPPSNQPWFVNAVAEIATELAPLALLDALLALEERFGRVRGERNAARVLDLDLLEYNGRAIDSERLVLPHPRLAQRRFVLVPLCAIAPCWRHPVSGLSAAALLGGLPPGQAVRRLGETTALDAGHCG